MVETISNTSPLLYLHQVRLLDIIPALFGRVLVPFDVVRELTEGRRLGHDTPDVPQLAWSDVVTPDPALLARVDVDLGDGERGAIALALARPGALTILDDRDARNHATALGVAVVGTLGVLARAKNAGHIAAVREPMDRMIARGLRASAATRAAVLKLAGE